MAVEWQVSEGPVAYPDAVAAMERRIAAIRAGQAGECVWLLEHPPLYTAGTSARPGDLLDAGRFPVFASGRGGQYTYHGPGQRVAYVMLDLRQRGADVRGFVCDLERWLIDVLQGFGIKGERRPGRIGVWVDRGLRGEAKIAALGIRVRHWVSYHGVALNVSPDLSHFAGIVPCGIRDAGVTSLTDLGVEATMAEVDLALQHCFHAIFDPAPTAQTTFEHFAAAQTLANHG
ncbi:MAG: lipoyl(octanoyl) transferase LipB [Alphaproteobacteria bacterium]|nr:lipoyl(octanoyl) transferase LipB [Alphaproteobacteria bacterium]